MSGRIAPRIALAALAGLAALCAASTGPASLPGVVAQSSAQAYVNVQYASKQVATQRPDGLPPALEELGFRTVPVPAGVSADDFLKNLQADPDVLSATADGYVYGELIPDDPRYLTGQAAYLSAVNAPGGWEIATGGPKVTVAILDTGIDFAHEDLQGRFWENKAEIPGDGIDNDGNSCIDDRNGCRFLLFEREREAGCGYTSSERTGAVQDDHGAPGAAAHSHGSIAAGIVGAAGNNARGIAGMAWDVRLMAVKVLDCGIFGAAPRGRISDIARGIDYARLNGARVISLSVSTDAGDPLGDQPVLRAAMQAAEDAGVIIVAAVGNHPENDTVNVAPGYPAAYSQYSNLVAVGASEVDGTWAKFSNYGPAVDLAAPGRKIAGTTRTAINPANPYGAVDGTSFSTPIVAGLFALLWSRNPRLPIDQVIQIARTTATTPPFAPHGQNWAGAGVINVGAALARVPMSISGDALKDWKDVGAGTEVRAFVNGADCGVALVTTFGPVANYTITVRSDAEQIGCGEAGRTVQLTIGGQPAFPTLSWPARNEELLAIDHDVSSVSPGPGPIVVQGMGAGWSNFANLEPDGPLPAAVPGLTGVWTALLAWDATAVDAQGNTGVYRRFLREAPPFASDLATTTRYSAMWVDSAASNIATANPNPPAGRAILLETGWNNIVYTGTTREVSDALASIGGHYKQVLQYDNPAGLWLSYLPGQARYLQDFGGMGRLKVYWILMTEPGLLIMN